MKYLIIFEDSSLYKTDTISDDDKSSCDNGILDIVDMGTGKQYLDGEWNDIANWSDLVD